MIGRLIAVRKRAGIHCRSPVRAGSGYGWLVLWVLVLQRRPRQPAWPSTAACLQRTLLTACWCSGPWLPVQIKILVADRDVYAARIEGNRGKLLMKVRRAAG